MQRSRLTGQRLVAVFLVGCVLFNFPILALFDRAATVAGVPLVFAYLFFVWAGLILLMAWVVERRGEQRGERSGG